MNKPLVFFLAVMCVLPGVLSLGVSPAKIDVDFAPNLKWDFTINVINNEGKPLDVMLYSQGPLADSVSFREKSIHMGADEYSKPVAVTLNLPDKIEEPGLHEILIVVKEGQKAVGDEPISIGSSLNVVSMLRVNVPYQGKYAKAALFISEADPGQEVTFAVEVQNLGKEDISAAGAKISIAGPDGKVVARVDTDEKPVVSMTKRELIAKWMPSEVGRYSAEAVVDYDGKETSASKEFNVGSFFLKLLSITVKNFKLGGIAKFDILTENMGNDVIAQAYSKMSLDEAGKSIMEVESNRIDVKPDESKVMNGYWDTEGVSRGVYYGLVRLLYSDKSSENKIKMTVEDDDITTEIITGMTVAPQSSGVTRSGMVSVVVIFSLAAASAGFFFIRKRIKGRQGKS